MAQVGDWILDGSLRSEETNFEAMWGEAPAGYEYETDDTEE